MRLARGGARLQEAAGGEELGVEKGGAGGTAHEVVREEREFYVEQGTHADAADDRGHAVAGVDVAAGLRAIFLVENDDGMAHGGRERGQPGADFKGAQGFAHFVEGSDFLQADGDTFEVAVNDWHAIAMSAKAEAGIDEARAIPLTEQLLR